MTDAVPVDVTVVGEALVDVVERDGIRTDLPGGSPLNVAVGLGRLGRSTSLVSEVGSDALGDLLRTHLAQSAVDVSALVPVGRTSTALAAVGADGGARYEFDIAWKLESPPEVPPSRLLHVGSIGAWMQPGASRVAAMVAARLEGCRASFDPNVRATLIDDRRVAVATIEGLMAQSDLVKLSDEDAQWLYPESGPDEVLDTVLARGAGIAVLTLGAQGATASTRSVRLSLGAPPVRVADTIGAGDSFMAGLLDAWLTVGLITGADLDREDLARMLWAALGTAAITVSRAGANPPWRSELA